MKTKIALLLAAIAALAITTAAHGALLVYEPFNYNVTTNLTGLNGGMGFSGGWLAHAADGSGGAVYDQTTTNVAAGTEVPKLTWDGIVNNLPTLPAVGARYQGARTNNSNQHINRTLAASAGAMAATNGGVLWMSAVYHWVNLGSLGSGINIGLGNGYIHNRGMAFSAADTTFIGANSSRTNANVTIPGWGTTFTYRLNAFATTNAWTTGGFTQTTNANTIASLGNTTNDLIVVLKYTFGASDIVEACVFTENETLSEAAFNTSTNRVSTTNSVDENVLTVLSLSQGRMANAQDELRIGTSFTDVVTLPPVGPVDIAISTVSASPTNVFADGVSTSTITVTLKDILGQAVSNKSVTLSSSPGNATITPAGAQITDTNGVVTFTATSTTAGTEVFTANDTTDTLTLSQTPSVDFTALVGDPTLSTVVASPTNVLANGISNSTITVTVRNAGGIPLTGKSVTLGASPGIATLSPPGAQITGSNGVVTFTASSTTVGVEVFTATNDTDSVVITQTASVDFSPTVADPLISTVVASPPGVYADGSSTSTLTVTLKNSTGVPLSGKSVTLSSSPGTATLSPPGAQATDANGQAIYTATSTTVGTEVFSATNTTDSVLITQTASVNFVAPGTPQSIYLNFYANSGALTSPQDPALLSGPIGGLGATWNQFNTMSGSNLVSASGVPTTVGFNNNVPSGWQQPATLEMLKASRAHFGKGEDTTNRITGLTPGSYYDLWVASYNEYALENEYALGEWSTPNPTATVGPQMIDCRAGLNSTSWEQGRNFVRFEYVQVDANGQIVLAGDAAETNDYGQNYSARLHLNGFQLVPTALPTLTVVPNAGNPGNYDFTWNSKAGKVYDLVSTNDLSAPRSQWPVWNGLTNIVGTPPSNTLTNIPGGGTSQRFFALIEKDSPVLLSADFEQNDGGFFAVGTPNDWAWGAPKSDNGLGLVVTNANGGSSNCWGTVLGDGTTPSGLITPGSVSVLQSPLINFRAVTNASLTFAAAVDAVVADSVSIEVREVGSNTLLGTLNPITLPASAGWASFGPLDLSVAVGKSAYLQFVFVGSDGTRIGLYIDDVVVTGD